MTTIDTPEFRELLLACSAPFVRDETCFKLIDHIDAKITEAVKERIATLELALDRIGNMKDRDGNYIKLHPVEMRSIALTALDKEP